jgi:hypothetical protein
VPRNLIPRTLPTRVADLLETSFLRIRPAVSPARLWEQVLTEPERQRLGGDLPSLWRERGTAGIWQKLRGGSWERAVVDVALALGLLDATSARWLLRELREVSDDPNEMIEAARQSTALVLVERPRAVYWKGKPIGVPWERYTALWQFFWELCRQAKASATRYR